MLEGLLPPSVAFHATDYDEHSAPDSVHLPAPIERAVPRRRAEFIAGRACARAALVVAGGDGATDIPIGPMRAPVWPTGFVGSITHAHGVAIAAVSRAECTRSIGIDLEHVLGAQEVPTLAPSVGTNEEWAEAAGLGLDTAATFTAVFSAKEALFKALALEVGHYFDFLDVEVVAAAPGRLTLRARESLARELRESRDLDAEIACIGDAVLAVVHRAPDPPGALS